jgi:serine protease inhibitor
MPAQATTGGSICSLRGHDSDKPPDSLFTPEFAADRPFVFLIRHDPSGAVLFAGRTLRPQPLESCEFC